MSQSSHTRTDGYIDNQSAAADSYIDNQSAIADSFKKNAYNFSEHITTQLDYTRLNTEAI